MTRAIRACAIACLLASAGALRGAPTDEIVYQGRLVFEGRPAVGSFSVVYRLFDALTEGTELASVTAPLELTAEDDGVFTSPPLDLGAHLDGGERWLEIAIDDGSGGDPVVLTPRQRLAGSGYAAYAARSGAGLGDAYANGRTIRTTDGPLRLVNADATSSLLLDGNAGEALAPSIRMIGPDRALTIDLFKGGNQAVVLPDASIGSLEIRDEPGAAASLVNGAALALAPIPLYSVITTRSITVPGPGYVVLLATCEIEVEYRTGVRQIVAVVAADAPQPQPGDTGPFGNGIENQIRIAAAQPDGTYQATIPANNIYAVTSGGTHTFYLVGQEIGGDAANVTTVIDASLILLYVPTAYGAVDAPARSPAGPAAPEEHLGPRRPGLDANAVQAEILAELQRHARQMEQRQRELAAQLERQRAAIQRLTEPGLTDNGRATHAGGGR